MYRQNISQNLAVHGLESKWERSYIHCCFKLESVVNMVHQRKTTENENHTKQRNKELLLTSSFRAHIKIVHNATTSQEDGIYEGYINYGKNLIILHENIEVAVFENYSFYFSKTKKILGRIPSRKDDGMGCRGGWCDC